MLKIRPDAIEFAETLFRNHKARYSKGFFLDVLDWKKPDTIQHWIRMVFDHERGETNALYISGDLGEAVVYPTADATLKSMALCFTRREKDRSLHVNVPYFLEKVKTGSCLYNWGMEEFQEDLRERFVQEYGEEEDQSRLDEFFEEYCDSYCSEVEVDNGVHITDSFAKDALEEIFPDYKEWIWECGSCVSNRVVFWLVAMRLAYEQVYECPSVEKKGDRQGKVRPPQEVA